MRTVIGLVGVKTSGKSTVADIIKENLATGSIDTVLESALADKLKNTSAQVFGLKREQFDDQNLKEKPFEIPKILDHDRIVQILESFNVEVTEELMQTYYTNNIEGMLLETPREIAQVVGTEVLRAAGDQDIHCKNVRIGDDITIVSDVRFPNEFEYFANLKNVKFLPLYIQRDEAEKHVTKDSHPSERCVFDFSDRCTKISNNGTLEELESDIKMLLVINGYNTKIEDIVYKKA